MKRLALVGIDRDKLVVQEIKIKNSKNAGMILNEKKQFKINVFEYILQELVI